MFNNYTTVSKDKVEAHGAVFDISNNLVIDTKVVQHINLVDDNECINPLFNNKISDKELEKDILPYNICYKMLTNHKHIRVNFGKDLIGYAKTDELDLLLLPDITVAKLLIYLKTTIKLYHWQALFLLTKNKMLMATDTIENVFDKYADNYVLVIDCYKENVFG